MTGGTCGECEAAVEPDAETCPDCGASLEGGADGLGLLAGLREDERAVAERGRTVGVRLGGAAALAVGLGLVLIGVGNGVWRLTGLGDVLSGGALGFILHLAAAALLVGLGASLLPLGLHLGREDPVPVANAVGLFSALWLVAGLVIMLAGADGRSTFSGGLVLFLAGVFGLVGVSSYDARRTGSAIAAGVMGLVAGGLLIGGVATLPDSLTEASAFGADLVFRYADPVQVSGYLVAVLAAALYPFVRGHRLGRAGGLLGASVGGVLWGLGELVFAVGWLAEGPWTLFAELDAGAATGYGFVVAGGLLTVVGGLAGLGAWLASATYAGVPLASALGTRERGSETSASRRFCGACGSAVTTSAEFCPGCGHELAEAVECPECQELMADDAEYCPACGEEVAPETVSPRG